MRISNLEPVRGLKRRWRWHRVARGSHNPVIEGESHGLTLLLEVLGSHDIGSLNRVELLLYPGLDLPELNNMQKSGQISRVPEAALMWYRTKAYTPEVIIRITLRKGHVEVRVAYGARPAQRYGDISIERVH